MRDLTDPRWIKLKGLLFLVLGLLASFPDAHFIVDQLYWMGDEERGYSRQALAVTTRTNLFRDDQRHILSIILESNLVNAEGVYRQVYDVHATRRRVQPAQPKRKQKKSLYKQQ